MISMNEFVMVRFFCLFFFFIDKAFFVIFALGNQEGQHRTEKMAVDQDWTAVYPVAAPFKANAVPLPVRMGYPVKGGVPPEKKGNLELIKVRPNNLH